jgi:hypothetical protein
MESILNLEIGNIELCILANYGGVMVMERGSSPTLSELLTYPLSLRLKKN